jgi:hypothetical protein
VSDVTDTAIPTESATSVTVAARAKRIMGEYRAPSPEFLKQAAMACHGGDEDAARKVELRWYIEERGVFCTGCRHAFEDGDVVYRKRGTPRSCRGCVSKWHPSWLEGAEEPVPCAGGCGVLVSCWRTWSYVREEWTRAVSTCSDHCAKQARNARRRKSKPTTCAGCGETFVPKRSDAKFCSAACKQRAYRQRSGSSP